MVWLIGLLLGLVALHAFLSLRYNYDWIGSNVRKWLVPLSGELSVTDIYPIPEATYMDRFGTHTRIPKMKENAR